MYFFTPHDKMRAENTRFASRQSITVNSHDANGAKTNVPTPKINGKP